MSADWIEAAEQKVSAGLVKLANQGSVPAATAVLKLLGEKRAASAASDHAARLVELAGDGPGLARYLGALGQSAETAAIVLARALTEAEAVAWNRGQLDRAIEARAIELHKARNAGKVENWMRKA